MWLPLGLNLLGTLMQGVGAWKNANAADKQYALQSKLLQNQAEMQRANDAANELLMQKYQDIQDKVSRNAQDIDNKYDLQLKPYKERRNEMLNDPESYNAKQMRAMERSPYGADAKRVASVMSSYSGDPRSAMGQEQLREGIQQVGKQAMLGYNNDMNAKQQNAYNQILQERDNEYAASQREADKILNMLGAKSSLRNNSMNNWYNNYSHANDLGAQKLNSTFQKNMVAPDLLQQGANSITDYEDNKRYNEILELQKKKLMEGAVHAQAPLPNKKKRPQPIV